MNQEDENEYIPYLHDQIKQYKSEREHITEKYLMLKEKFEGIKNLEVDLRYEIYQLKRQNSKYSESQYNQSDTIHLILKSDSPYLQAINLNGLGGEFIIKMNEDKRKTEHIDKNESTQHPATADGVVYEQAKEIAELKKQIVDMKALPEENVNEEKLKTKSSLDISSRKASNQLPARRLENITFRDIQTAKEVYQVTQRSKNKTHKKEKINQFLKNHKQIKHQANLSGTNPSLDTSEEKKENVSKKKEDKVINRTSPPEKQKKPEVIKEPLKDESLNHPIESHLKKDKIQSYIKENRSFFQSIWKKKK